MGELEANISRAKNYLARFLDAPLAHFINGEATVGVSSRHYENLSPVDNKPLGQVVAGDEIDIATACEASAMAFPAWRSISGKARRSILHQVADAIEARKDEIALVESMDTGQPIRFMSKAALRGAENFRFFADRAPDARNGQALLADEHINYTSRSPIGPVGVITPWNTPFMLSTWKIAPALAAGCTVVHKPAEATPLSATLLAEICTSAGLPPGVLNTVNGLGEDAGKALTEHSDVKALAFVGESRTGSMIMGQGADTLKRVHFELGGKNPVIVFDDADLERALDAVVFMIYSLNGERCTSSSRLLVQSSIYDDFVEAVAARVAKIQVGHPLDPDTEVGPLVDENHFKKVCSYFDIAKDNGATVREGGIAIEGPGNYVRPTLFSNATNSMRIAQEEIFGPVLTAIPFDDETDAVRIANDVRYGLAGYLWTRDIGRGHRIADQLEAGMVWVNSENNRHLPAPFGGTKDSGIGRDGGDYSFDFYMETKNVCVATGNHNIPRLGV